MGTKIEILLSEDERISPDLDVRGGVLALARAAVVDTAVKAAMTERKITRDEALAFSGPAPRSRARTLEGQRRAAERAAQAGAVGLWTQYLTPLARGFLDATGGLVADVQHLSAA